MYRLQCFGSAVVMEESGTEIHFRSRKHLGLLIYLCAHPNRAQDRARLATLFWDTGEKLAHHSLSQALYDLKRRLRPLQVRARAGCVRIEESHIAYEALELEDCLKSGDVARSVDLYRGEFAPNLVSVGTRTFQHWLEGEASRFRTLGQVALRRFVHECDRHGRWGELCLAALRLIKLDPLDEDAHRSLIKALWLQGDQPSALQHYAENRDFLLRELPGGPSEETLRLVERIRSSRAPVPFRSSSAECELPLVGRQEEFKVLRATLKAVGAKSGKVLVVKGEAGIGKTRLLQELSRIASVEGARCLRSRCYPAESDVAYGPVLDGIEPVARGIAESVEAHERRYFQLGHLFPGLFERMPEDEVEAIDPAVRRRRLFEEVADVVRHATQASPVVWIVEDIHWIDAASASLLHYLSRRLGDRAFLLILSVRSGCEIRSSARRLTDETSDPFQTETLTLPPLSKREIRELLGHASSGPSGQLAVSLAERYAGGNPFYALEILRAASGLRDQEELQSTGAFISDRLRGLLRLRLRGLSSRALRILEAVAILERHASPGHVGAVAGLTPDEVVEISEELRTRHLLKEADRRLEFVHDISREFLCSNLGLLQRAALHLTVGEVLATDVEVNPATLAHHFEQAGDRSRTYEYAMRSVERSVTSSAHKEAASMAALAVSVAKTQQDKLKGLKLHAAAEMAAGQFSNAEKLFEDILILFPDLSTWETVSARLSLARARVESSNWQKAQACLEKATDEISQLGDVRQRQEKLLEKLGLNLKIGILTQDEDGALAAYESIRDLYESGDQAGTLTSVARADALCSQVVFATFLKSSTQARELLDQMPTWNQELPVYLQLKTVLSKALVYIRSASWDEAESALASAFRVAKSSRDVIGEANVANNLACLYMEQGHWQLAEENCRRSSALLDSVSMDKYSALAPALNMAAAKFYQGYLTAAEQLYEESLRACEGHGDRHTTAEIRASLGLIAIQQGARAKLHLHWSELARLSSGLLVGAQERFKVFWLSAFLLSKQGNGGVAAMLAAAAEEERARDVVSYLKLLWLRQVLCEESAACSTREQKIEMLLREKGLLWFIRFSQRWLNLASHKWPSESFATLSPVFMSSER